MERRLSTMIVCGLLVAVAGVGLVSAGGLGQTGLVEDDPTAGTFVRPPKPAAGPLAKAANALPGGLRSLGDTCAEAIAITGLPFDASGNTCGFVNDYDEACREASIAPDVVYSFVSPQDMYVDIVLCESALDTKLYVYAGTCSGTPIGCSDDDDCGDDGYRSHLVSVPLAAGVTYYIVVDGYSNFCGAYILRVSEGIAPPTCPAASLFSMPVDIPNGEVVTSDEASDWRSYAYIADVTTPFMELNWWGINRGVSGFGDDCDKDPNVSDPNAADPYERVEITVFEDDNGWPGVPLCGPYHVKPQRTVTDFTMGGQPLYHYRALIPGCQRWPGTGIGTGWVSIFGLDDGQDCWHLWATHGPADPNDPAQQSVQLKRSTGEFWRRDFALSLCLGDQIDPSYLGACCDPVSYVCHDGVLATDCIGGSPWATFGYTRHDVGLTCDELTPPCEPWWGACCYIDGTCALRTYLGCEHAGDLNCNGLTGFDDINPFVDALLEGPEGYAQLYPNCNYYRGDISQDTPPHVGFEDINPFVDLLMRDVRTGTWLGPDTTCADCPCVVPCPVGGIPEAETCGDAVNDGCGMSTPDFEPLTCNAVVCGRVYANGTSFDRDQFVVTVTGPKWLELRVEAEFPVRFGFLEQTEPGVAGCDNLTGYFDVASATGTACDPNTVGLAVGTGTYYLAVQPQNATTLPGCPPYTLSLSCAPYGACCLPNGDCVMSSDVNCSAQEGDFQGPLTVCDPNNNSCPQPPQDDCERAGVIVDVPYDTEYDNDDANADGPAGPCDPYHPPDVMQNDVWWQWTAPADAGVAQVVATPIDYNMVMTVWKGENCVLHSPGDVVACACSTSGTGNIESITFETDPNATYYIQVGDTGTTSGGGPTLLHFEFSVFRGACCLPDDTCVPDQTPRACADTLGGTYMGNDRPCEPNPCAGDTCARPIVVALDPNVPSDPNEPRYVDLGSTTCGRGNDYANTCLEGYDAGEDIVYRLEVASPMDVRIVVDPPADTYSGVALMKSCPDPNVPVPCVAWDVDSIGNGQPYGITRVTLDPNETYYLIVDSWSPPECVSAFDLRIEMADTCDVTCDPNAPDTIVEGEPVCYDTYNDTYNGGCNDPNRSFTPLACGQTVCGESGTFLMDPNDPLVGYRDTDWYEVTTSEPMKLTWTITAEFAAQCLILDASLGCQDDVVLMNFITEPCELNASATTACVAAGTYWVFVRPAEAFGVPCGAKYRGTLTCEPSCTVYCLARSENCSEYIAGITVAGDPNSTYVKNEGTCDHYIDYTDDPIPMTAGQSYTLSVIVGAYYEGDIVNAWIDWDGDGYLPSDPRTLALTYDGDGMFIGEVVPTTSGSFHMRMRLEYRTSIGPCGTSLFGEVEDYLLEVQAAP